jgi:O-antigen ligase
MRSSDYSLGEIKNEIGYSLMAFVAFFAWTRDEKRLRLLCLALAAGFVVISVSALFDGLVRGKEWHATAFYGGVGNVSHYLVTITPVLALAAVLFGRERWGRGLAVLGLLLLAIALLTGRRAIWPAVAVQVALTGFWLWKTRAAPAGLYRLSLIGFVSVALVAGGLYLSERIRTGGDPESRDAVGKDLRLRVWKGAGWEILEHPLTGAGFGRRAMSKAYPELVPAENPLLWHAHNLVLNYGLSAGVPGMAAVLILFASLAWRFWRLALHGQPLARLTGLAGIAMVAGVFTRCMADDFFVRDGSLLFWALAGMLFGYALPQEPASGPRRA